MTAAASAAAASADRAGVRTGVEEIAGLTTLRGLGSFVVVLYHVGLAMPEAGILDLPFFYKARPWIDIFFVLSGFVLCHVHGHEFGGRISFAAHGRAYRDFLVKRIARVYPLHLAMLGALLALLLAWNAARWHDSPAGRGLAGLFLELPWRHVARHLTLTQSWWFDFSLTLNVPAWSISMEWAIYLGFPWIVMAARSLTRRGIVPAIFVLFVALFLVSLIKDPGKAALTNIYGLPRTVVAFTFGVCVRLALWAPERTMDGAVGRILRHDATAVLSFVLLGIGMSLGWHDVVLVGLVVAFTCAVGLNDGAVARVSAYPALHGLGVISYSTYLVHWPLLLALSPVFRPFVASAPPLPALWAAAALCIVLSHAAALLTYRWIEVPGRRWVRRRFLDRHR